MIICLYMYQMGIKRSKVVVKWYSSPQYWRLKFISLYEADNLADHLAHRSLEIFKIHDQINNVEVGLAKKIYVRPGNDSAWSISSISVWRNLQFLELSLLGRESPDIMSREWAHEW